jgi:hypothetical protein
MYSVDNNSLNEPRYEKPSKDSTVKEVLHEINHFQYKNFSKEVAECFASRSLKKIVLNLADSLFQQHRRESLSKKDFNKLISDTTTAIIKEDSFTSPEYGNASRQQIQDQKQQLVKATLEKALQELFENVANTSNNPDLQNFIGDLKSWSRTPGQSTSTVTIKQSPVSYLPPPEALAILATLKLQVSNHNTSTSLPIGQVSENFSHPLIAQLSQVKQDSSTGDSYRTIEIKSQDDLRMFNQILANRNDYGRLLDHELRVDFSHYEGRDFSRDVNFIQADFSGLKLKFFVHSTLDGSFENIFNNILIEGARHFANDVALKLFQRESIPTKNIQPQSWSVVVVETDPNKMSIARIEREVDNTTAGLAKLSLLGLVNSKKNKTAQFIEDNRQSIHDAILENFYDEIQSILINQYLTKQVQDLRGASSPQILNVNDERIIPFLKNIKQMEVNLKTVLQDMNPQIDVTYKPLTQTESFSESIQQLKSNVNSLGLNTRVNLLAAIYQQEEQPNLVNSISDKFANTFKAKQFINEYIEQRFQANVDKKDRVTSEIAFETFIRKSSVVYGLSGEDLKVLILKCEEYFRTKSTTDLIQPEENKIFRFTTQSNSEVFGELSKDPGMQLLNFAFKDGERLKVLAKQEDRLGECESRLKQEAFLFNKLFEAKPLAAVLADLFSNNWTEKASDILSSAVSLVSEKNIRFSTQYPNIGANVNPLEILQNNLLEYERNFQAISARKEENFAAKYLNIVADFQSLSSFSQRGIDHMFSDPIDAEVDLKALMIELNAEAMNGSLPPSLTNLQKDLLEKVLDLFNDGGVNESNYTAATEAFMTIIQGYARGDVSGSLHSLLLPYVEDFLTPKSVVIEKVLTQSFKDSSFDNYSDEQKSLYIDLQQHSQKLSDSDFSSYITTNLFKKYLENKVKLDNSLEFGVFAFQTLTTIASIDSSLEQALVFNREPGLTKISTNPSCLLRGEVWKNSPETLIAHMLKPLDKNLIHDLPGYSQITDQVKSVFIDTLLGNSSFDAASDTLAKLLRDSIPSKETVLTVPVNEDFDPDLYSMVISKNGTEAQVLAVPPRASNDKLLGQIMKQCAKHLHDFVRQINLSQDTSQAAFYDSFFGKLVDIFTGSDKNAKQALSKKIISSELERNFPGKLFSDLLSPRSHEILNERAIQKQFLFANLEPSGNSPEVLADIDRLYEFITNMNSQNSPYQRFNGLVLDEAGVQSNLRSYGNLNNLTEPAMKQHLFDEINLDIINWAEATKLGINSNKYKEFRIDILLMQRKQASQEEIQEFVKLNLASVFEIVPENKAETVEAIGKLIKNIDSNLTSDMQMHSLSRLNLEPSIKAALDTPANKIKNQMQTAIENVFTSNTDIKLPETINNINAPEIQFYLDTQKLITEMRLANPASASAGTEKDISNAIFGKLAAYINKAAKEANLEDFNLLALRDEEKEFVTDLLNNLGASNKALDDYFTAHYAQVFETSVQSVFQPSSVMSVLASVNDTTDVQALIDNAVINLLVAPDENTLRAKAFGTDAINRTDELRIPRNKDIRQAYIEASRELINNRRTHLTDEVTITQGIVSEDGAFTQNIKGENTSGRLSQSKAEALFYGQYKAFADLSEQATRLLKKPEFEFLQDTFCPTHNTLSRIAQALQNKESSGTEGFIKSYLLADQGTNSSPNAINASILSNKLNIGEKEAINSLALISLVLKGNRQAVAQELKEYLETKDSFLADKVDGGRIPYINTASTHTKLQAGIALGEELSTNSSVKNGLVENAVIEGIQAVIDSVKTAHGKDSTVKLISNNYPSEALADIITKSIFGESQNLDASVYKLYKGSGYDPEVLKQTETILVGLNNLAKAGKDFEVCPDLQAKCTELNTSWEDTSLVNLKVNPRLDFAITEEVKLNDDDNLDLVKAYVNLRKGFSTAKGFNIAIAERDSENFRLIGDFKKIYHEQNPRVEYNAQKPAYLTMLEDLNGKYSSIVEHHGTALNAALVKNITDFIKDSDDLLSSVSTSAKNKLIEKFKSAEIAKSHSVTEDQKIIDQAGTYVKTYNQMQILYRQNPAFFEDSVDEAIDAVLNPSTKQGDSIAKANGLLGTFANIIKVLDEIFGDILVDSPKANFIPLLDIYNKIRQEQSKKFY